MEDESYSPGGVEVRKSADIKITCRQCGKEFVFTKDDQAFYEQRGLTAPRRCKECRSAKRDNRQLLVCSQCGTKLNKKASVYCDNCIASTRLECEFNIKKLESAVDEACRKLEAVEQEKDELKESLHHKEQVVSELEEKVDSLTSELHEVRKLQAALDQWFQPRFDSLREKTVERLEAVEQVQNTISERISQLTQRVHDMDQNMTLLELAKRSLRKLHKQPRQDIQNNIT